MKKSLLIMVFSITLGFSMSLVSCKKEESNDPEPTPITSVIEVSGEITANTTWTSDKKYLLKGFVYVLDGITLTIQPGTIIKGDKTTMGTLIIERGGKIMAEGTATNPIVFTSNAPVNYRNRGDWGGIVICGKAPVNQTDPQIEGGPRSHYGGTDALDNSGTLKYVRIEYAGYPFQPDKEVNGLTFCAVGSGTTIDYVMVSYSNDDSFEWFGGTVNCKHLCAYKGLDDDFDTDYGFIGKCQFFVALRDKNVADISGSNSFESDNDASGSDNSPYTHPIFCNVSVFGPKATSSLSISSNYKNSMHIRRNSRLCVYNSVFAGSPGGLLLDGTKCETNATNGDLQIQNVTISGCTSASTFFSVASSGATWTASQLASWYFGASNDTLMNNSSLKVTDPWGVIPNFLPQSGSPLLGTASFTNTILQDSFFDNVSYRGAFGTTDWLSGWANYDPQTTAY